MLQLKNIKKVYKTKYSAQTALKDINLTFKEGEFVSVLGPSGCGKTTLLNIIGGLDRYTSGDLIINGKSTKNFTTSDWDSYRNHSVGFVFQNYNLIHHISILDNVEMGMTLSGVKQTERRQKAIDVLKRVGLEEHMHKKPYQLSGGQKQRVAIARALVNNPDVILADEPTGALDTKTSTEVLDLIKEISKEKLVIMVTHNQALAEEYSTRIVRLLDGDVINDSKPVQKTEQNEQYSPNKTAMNFLTALKLSFNNLKTKKVRTLITALAGSIGIIGISLVLSISNGFKSTINDLEQNTFAGFPIQVGQYHSIDIGVRAEINRSKEKAKDELVPYNSRSRMHENMINQEYLDYLNAMNQDYTSSIQYIYGLQEQILVKNNDVISLVKQREINWSPLYDDNEFTKTQYDILQGRLPQNANEIVLVVDNKNQVDESTLTSLGLPIERTLQYHEVMNKELVIGYNNDMFEYDDSMQKYFLTRDYNVAYNNGITLKIVGILRGKSEGLQSNNRGIYYSSQLTGKILNETEKSAVCQAQLNTDTIVVGDASSTSTKEQVLETLGCVKMPTRILIYPKNNDVKDKIRSYLDAYNENKAEQNQILYNDLSDTIASTLGQVINYISYVLVAFAAISLVVSSIMIGIITYVSVLERTKEIGILRSLGARKKDITRVFNAETFIVGLVAGTIGIVITFVLSFPINLILRRFEEGLSHIVKMSIPQSFMLIVISIALTFIAGLIPSRIAANKDPVEALRHNE